MTARQQASRRPETPHRTEGDVPTHSLLPNPRNPRKHSDEQVRRLMASLQKDGQTKPVVARLANAMLIAGHGIHRAAMAIGMPTLHAVFLDVDQQEADRIMLGDNTHSDLSTTDKGRVSDILREIEAEDWLATGFSEDDAAKVFEKVEAADLVVHEIETSERKDTFWISVYGPMGLQADALQRLKVLYAEMPGLQVVLGTTPDLH